MAEPKRSKYLLIRIPQRQENAGGLKREESSDSPSVDSRCMTQIQNDPSLMQPHGEAQERGFLIAHDLSMTSEDYRSMHPFERYRKHQDIFSRSAFTSFFIVWLSCVATGR